MQIARQQKRKRDRERERERNKTCANYYKYFLILRARKETNQTQEKNEGKVLLEQFSLRGKGLKLW